MKLVRYLSSYQAKPCVLTIGNFDGIHLGHQAVFKQLNQLKQRHKLPSVIMSFTPIPAVFFGKEQTQITNFKERLKLVEDYHIDDYLLLKFDQTFANLSADEFINDILIKTLKVKHLIIGDDFVFGKNRKGNKTLLEQYNNHFYTHQIKQINQKNIRISSSEIRQALAKGNFLLSQQQLGREFSMTGCIIYGDQRGRTIGFPTLNIPLKRKNSPILGVFTVGIILNGHYHQGVANIGKKPTINGQKIQLEVFVFNFNKMVYGEIAQVIFYEKIRDEQKFSSLEDLKQQIQNDVNDAKHYFKTKKN